MECNAFILFLGEQMIYLGVIYKSYRSARVIYQKKKTVLCLKHISYILTLFYHR